METTRDETMPASKWAFDAAVTDAFDDMLERSIPAYNLMRELTTRLAIRFALPDSYIVDLGCSRGSALRPLVDHFTESTDEGMSFLGVDVSEPMLAAARQTFARDHRVTIREHDLRSGYPTLADGERASVTLAVLTLQFTPIEYRQMILSDVYQHTASGGVVLVVEKVLGNTADLHRVFDDEYLSFKARSGYTEEQIARKKASLEGVLVSLDADHNASMLYRAGFRSVDCYYRWLNFAGWVAVK